MSLYAVQVILACVKKDLKSALTEPLSIFQSMVLPLNYLLLMCIMTLSGSNAPVAVVMHDRGPYAQQILTAMAHAHSFRVLLRSTEQAQALYTAGKLVAVVTIPADFDTKLQRRHPVQLALTLNNVQQDATDDVRRAMALTLMTFSAQAFPDQVTIVPDEHDLYAHDTDYIPFLAMSVLIIGVMVGGMLQAATAMAREWETETIKGFFLSPAPHWAILAGKMLAAALLGFVPTLVILTVVVFVVGDWPHSWGVVLGVAFLALLLSVSLGVLLGTLIKQQVTVTPLVRSLPILFFFLSGSFGLLSYQTPPIQLIARLTPVHYCIVLLQYGFSGFRTNTLSLGSNLLIVVLFTAGVLLLTSALFQRSMLAH